MAIVRNVFSCPKAWNSMPGDQFARTCPDCSRTVYDLTHLRAAEVVRFVMAHDGKVCARIHTDEQGYVVNGECTRQDGTEETEATVGKIEMLDRLPWARTDGEHARAALQRLQELEGKAKRTSWKAWDL
jgi:hypothetical protein